MKKDNTMKKHAVTDINGTKKSNIKTTVNEDIQNSCWMDLEAARQRLHSFVDNLENTYGNADSN